jgi:predicted ribosome quality control (RQC) complex YloA/Tae2 family protein
VRGAIVQKVDRPMSFCFLISLRAPGRSIALAVVTAPGVAAIGPIADPPKKRAPADAETMRWRKHLEGARLSSVSRKQGWARATFTLGGERAAIVATERGATLIVDAGAEPTDDEAVEPDEAAWMDETQAALARAEANAIETRRRALVAAIDRARKKLERRIEAVREDLRRISESDALVEKGKLLAANAHAIARGAKEATLEDWSSGEAKRVTIALDPSKPARAQAEALFARAKRMKRGAPIAETRLREAERKAAALSNLREEAIRATDERAIEIAEGRAELRGGTTKGARSNGRSEETRRPYLEFRSGAHTILVGRGAKDNDALTTEIARPHDLWLHAKGWKGAHVVVRLDKGASCLAEVLVDAAHLAAHFSDARGESTVEVQYAEKRHVRKPRGAAPGAVVVAREKVMVLRVQPMRIQRILSQQDA